MGSGVTRVDPEAVIAARSETVPIIETAALTKRFSSVLALNKLSVTVPRAAIGLLGPNGAGKTTLIRLLLGLSLPTSGSATVLGMDTRTDSIGIRERVGYMPESECLPSNATAADFVGHMAEMSGIPKVHARQRAADVLYQVGLDEERYRLISGFSTGMKQRVKLAQALVHDPQLVFLDEPTAGMDPPGRDAMLELITRVYRLMGMSVVLSSHILEDIERICDYVVIINGGKLMMSQPIGASSVDEQEMVVRIGFGAEAFIERLATYGIDEARIVTNGQSSPFPELIVGRGDDQALDAIRDTAIDLGVPLRSLRGRAHSLEELYLTSIEGTAVAQTRGEVRQGE
ncbi:ABC transporter ATP-binding protein [soil metagenome]